jgi:hypothetical protein
MMSSEWFRQKLAASRGTRFGTGHAQNGKSRPESAQPISQLDAAHPGHNDVPHHQNNAAGVPLELT